MNHPTHRARLNAAQLATATCLLLAGCAGATGPGARSATAALLPDYAPALRQTDGDVLAFFRAWLGPGRADDDSEGRLAYVVSGEQDEVTHSLDRLLAGYDAFCGRAHGKVATGANAPGQRCTAADGALLAQLNVDLLHAAEGQPAQLAFNVETGERVQRLQAERHGLHVRLLQAQGKTGPGGSVVLASGAAFEVARFGRLSASDYYAIRVRGQPPIPLADIRSVRWNDNGLVLTWPDGATLVQSGKDTSPARTLVRVLASGNDSVSLGAMTYDAPFRFVVLDGRKQPRQVRIRNLAEVLEITVSRKPAALADGRLTAQVDRREQERFSQALANEARKAAAKAGAAAATLDLSDPKRRQEIERMGVGGPCATSQSDSAVKSGDLSFSEYYVCAEYRREAKLLLANGGAVTPDKTPLIYLGQQARAPWFDFGGVLR